MDIAHLAMDAVYAVEQLTALFFVALWCGAALVGTPAIEAWTREDANAFFVGEVEDKTAFSRALFILLKLILGQPRHACLHYHEL